MIVSRFNESNDLKYQKSIKKEMLSIVYICYRFDIEKLNCLHTNARLHGRQLDYSSQDMTKMTGAACLGTP